LTDPALRGGLAAAGPLDDLGLLVLGDHALELHQQLILGAVAGRPVEEADLGARPGGLLDQRRLVGVAAGQPIGRVAQHDLDGHLGDQVAQALQRRADQGRARVALVLEHPLGRNIKSLLLGVGQQRRGLASDRLLLGLAGGGHPGVDGRGRHRCRPFVVGIGWIVVLAPDTREPAAGRPA